MRWWFEIIEERDFDDEDCEAIERNVWHPDWCPLRPLPETHGDLVDRQVLMDEAKRISGPITGDGWDNWGVYALIDRQPAIVEAEGE